MRSERKLKRVHQCSKAHGTEDFSSSVFPGHSSLSTLEKSCGTLVPKRDSSGNSNLTNGVNCLRNTVSKSNGARRSQNPQAALEGSQSVLKMCQLVWLGAMVSSGSLLWSRMSHLYCRWRIMRTLQASLDLDDNGDKVILRQFGGESSLRTLKSGHMATRANQFDPDGWQLPEIAELCQNNDQGVARKHMSAIAHLHQRPRCTNDNTPAGDHHPASTRSCRPRQKTTSNGNGTARSHPTHFPTSSSRFKSGKQTHCAFQNHERDIWTSSSMRPVLGRLNGMEHLWTIRQWKRLAHYTLYVRCGAFFVTLSREFLMLIPMGRSEDIRLALRRREQREMKNKKSNVANLLEAQWVRGKSPTER